MDIDNITMYENIKKTLESDTTFTKSDFKLIKDMCIELFKDFINNNILLLSNSSFDKELTTYIYDNIKENLLHMYNNSNKQIMKKKLKKIIKKTTKYSWKKVIPYRSYKDSFIRNPLTEVTLALRLQSHGINYKTLAKIRWTVTAIIPYKVISRTLTL